MDVANTKKFSPIWLFLVMGVLAAWVNFGSHSVTSHSYDITEIEIAQATKLIDSGAIVIDARTESAYDGRHIPNSMLIPLAVLRAGIPMELLAFKGRDIVVYCNEGRHIGPEATHILNEAGFARAVNLISGIEGWAAAGLPVLGK